MEIFDPFDVLGFFWDNVLCVYFGKFVIELSDHSISVH